MRKVNCITSSLLCDITQRRVAIPYRRFGTSYRSHMQGPRNPKVCSETAVRNHKSTLRNIAEQSKSYLHRGGNSKSRTV